ncbi:MAG: TIGR04219 family outer membrane beta-barrel protein [Desulfobacterales bacterium]
MKRLLSCMLMAAFLMFPAAASALPGIDIEAAVGGWQQTPSGDLSYVSGVPGIEDTLDLEDDFGFEEEIRMIGRLKIDIPVIPTIYVVAAPMEFEGDSESIGFTFGDQDFQVGSISSKLTLNQYDIGLYYGIPFLKTATLGKLNIDIGLNVRIADINAEVTGQTLAGARVTESKSVVAPIPMLYLAAQFKPVDRFALEVEARGISTGDDKIYSLVGRVKVKVLGPAFAAGGYRYDVIDIDEEDLVVNTNFGGPFLEAGVQF